MIAARLCGDHFGVGRLHCGLAGGVAKQHPPGVGVSFDVGEPGIDRPGYAPLGADPRRQLLAPQLTQLGVVALQQAAVELELGGEVVIDDRGGHARAPGDLVDRGRRVAALREQLACGCFDQLAPRRARSGVCAVLFGLRA